MKLIKPLFLILLIFSVLHLKAQKPLEIPEATELISNAPPPMPTQRENCGGTTVTVASPNSGFTYYWQINEKGTSTTNSESIRKFTVSGTHYLRSYNTLARSWSDATEFYVNVKEIPDIPTVEDNGRCGPGIVSLTAVVGKKMASAQWYYLGKLQYTGLKFIADVEKTTAYTVSTLLDGCSSEGTSVQAIVSSGSNTATGTLSTPYTIVAVDDNIVLSYNGRNVEKWSCEPTGSITSPIAWLAGQGRWYDHISSASSITDQQLQTGNYTYRVQVDDANSYCPAISNEVTVQVIDPALNTSTASLSYIAGGETKSLSLSGNLDWSVSAKPSWISSVTPSSGSGDATVTISCSANTELTSRSHTLTFTGKLNGVTKQTKTLTVTQPAFVPTLSASLSKSTTNYEAGTFSINVSSNTSWTIANDQTWLSLSSTSGNGNETVTGTYTQNPSINVDRTAILTLAATGATTVTKSFTQTQAPEIKLTTSNLSVRYEGEVVRSSFTPEMNYTISTPPEWVSILSSGDGLAGTARYIVFLCSENESFSTRSTNVTITGTDGTYAHAQTITITQDGVPPIVEVETTDTDDIPCYGGEKIISVFSNTTWTATENLDWLSLSSYSGTGDDEITITCTQNWSTEELLANISFTATDGNTITFSATQLSAPEVIILASNMNFTAESERKTIVLDYRGADGWQLKQSHSDWISARNGEEISPSIRNVLISCTTNTAMQERTETIVFQGYVLDKNSERIVVAEKELIITQAAGEPYILAVESITVPYYSTSKTIAVQSNTMWTATKSASWFTMTKAYNNGSSGNGTLTVTYDKNLVASNRYGTITLQATNGNTHNITFTQQRAPILYSQEFSGMSFSTTTETSEMSLNAELDWEITDYPDWIESISPLSGTSSGGEQQIFITCTENTTILEKTGEIVFAGIGIVGYDFTQNMPVSQAAADPVLNISESATSISCSQIGSTIPVSVTTNLAWQVIESEDWISVTNPTGTNSGSFNIIIAENSENATKTGTLTLRNTTAGVTVDDIVISVSQAAAPPCVNLLKDGMTLFSNSISLGYYGSASEFEVQASTNWSLNPTAILENEWFNTSVLAGPSGKTDISFNGDYNYVLESRSLELVFQASAGSGYSDVTFTITQNGLPDPPFIDLSKTTEDINDNSGSFTFAISSNTKWFIAIEDGPSAPEDGYDEEWLTVDKSYGMGDDLITVSYTNVPVDGDISKIVRVHNNGTLSTNLSVSNVPIDPIFEIDSENSAIEFDEPSKIFTVNVTSNLKWEATSYQDWVIIGNAVGENNGMFTIGIDISKANNGNTGTVHLKATNALNVDDIVINVNVIFNVMHAIASGNWSDPTIWAYYSGGESANAIPNQDTKVFIDGYIVNVNQNSQSANITLTDNLALPTQLNVINNTLTVYGQVELNKTKAQDLVKLKVTHGSELICVEEE